MHYHVAAQDARYREIRALCRASGQAADYAGRSFDHFDLRPFLEQVLPQLPYPDPASVRVLEYGTGTGPGACFLAARGFRVDAIDLSATAIELAREFAAARHLSIAFEVADISQSPCPDRKYDLIVDNFCLHCIISDTDRSRTFHHVRTLLQRGGHYIIGTALLRPGRDFGEDRFDPATGIAYRRVPEYPHYHETLVLDGQSYVPWRRYLSAPALAAELQQAGFTILTQENGRVLCQIS